MEEITIKKIEWSAPEYKHEEKSIDFIWAIGLISVIAFGIALWFSNYLFAIFIFISGCSLVFFSLRQPEDVNFSIETSGLTLGKNKYEWKNIKGFNIKKEESVSVLLIEIDKYFLPVYTIPFPINLMDDIKESLLKVIPNIELEESKSMKFMEKLGF